MKNKKNEHRRQCWCIQVFFSFFKRRRRRHSVYIIIILGYIRWKIYVILSSLRTGVKLLHSNYMVDYIPFVDFCTDVVISSFSYILFIRVRQRTCYCITSCMKKKEPKWIYMPKKIYIYRYVWYELSFSTSLLRFYYYDFFYIIIFFVLYSHLHSLLLLVRVCILYLHSC